MNRRELLLTGLLKKVRRLIVTEPMRGRLQYFKRDPGFQVLLGLRERFQLLIGRHHRLIVVHLTCLALRIGPSFWKEAGPVEGEVGRELLPSIPAELQQIANDQPLMGLREGQILTRDHARLNPLITVILGTEHGTRDGLGPRQEVFQLRKGRQRMESHDGFHPPIMPETQPGFRLTSWWKYAPRSDSFHCGRDSFLTPSPFRRMIDRLHSLHAYATNSSN